MCWELHLPAAAGAVAGVAEPGGADPRGPGPSVATAFWLQRSAALEGDRGNLCPQEPATEYMVVARRGQELSRSVLKLSGHRPRRGGVVQPVACRNRTGRQIGAGAAVELARETMELPAWEAEVVARPDAVIHPVDLGCILVPSDWLLLRGGQAGVVEGRPCVAHATCRMRGVTVWFESAPTATTHCESWHSCKIARHQFRLPLPTVPSGLDRDTLHVSINTADGELLWQPNDPHDAGPATAAVGLHSAPLKRNSATMHLSPCARMTARTRR